MTAIIFKLWLHVNVRTVLTIQISWKKHRTPRGPSTGNTNVEQIYAFVHI
jgi:hypothetical protein